ncbi:hypothetical protein [Candidatus Uabimicrobium sp. HlEnr_7]|uniref:hypothetical protein n=1 Tax=Candidatus Uabimicrobium helgolandensis TaxID=3095367 RepID=UPI0035583FFD
MNPDDYVILQKKVEENSQEISFLKEKIAFLEQNKTLTLTKPSAEKRFGFFLLDIILVLVFLAVALATTAFFIEEAHADLLTGIFMFVVIFPIASVVAGILGMKTSKSIKNFFQRDNA